MLVGTFVFIVYRLESVILVMIQVTMKLLREGSVVASQLAKKRTVSNTLSLLS